MACAFGFKVFFLAGRHAAAHIQCRAGLPCTRDVVQLAFYGHHGGGLDVAGLDALGFAFDAHHIPGAVDQLELLENCLDGFQVVVSVHVQHGVVLVVKLAVYFGVGVIAFDQVLEIIKVALGVVAGIHGHETGVLQKARVDFSACARKVAWHAVDHIVFKPLVGLGGGQVVNRCG